MVLEPHSTFGFSLLLSGSDCPLCSVLFLVDSLTSLSCIYAAFCSGGRRHLLAPPGKDEKNFMHQKNDDYNNHRLCVLFHWLRSGIESYADRKLSPCCQFFVSVLCRSSDLSIHVRRIFPRTNALLQPSRGAMTALQMTGFHRTQDVSCMENNTLELQLLSEACLAAF